MHMKTTFLVLLLSGGFALAQTSTVGMSNLVVRDYRGELLMTHATYRGLSGARLVFRENLRLAESSMPTNCRWLCRPMGPVP